jgi:hypothetical protein
MPKIDVDSEMEGFVLALQELVQNVHDGDEKNIDMSMKMIAGDHHTILAQLADAQT